MFNLEQGQCPNIQTKSIIEKPALLKAYIVDMSTVPGKIYGASYRQNKS